MTCYSPSGYIIFSLQKLKFYGGWAGARTVLCETDVRAKGRGPNKPPIDSGSPVMKFQNPIIIHY